MSCLQRLKANLSRLCLQGKPGSRSEHLSLLLSPEFYMSPQTAAADGIQGKVDVEIYETSRSCTVGHWEGGRISDSALFCFFFVGGTAMWNVLCKSGWKRWRSGRQVCQCFPSRYLACDEPC